MRFIDFLFWHYYSWMEQLKKKHKDRTYGESEWVAILLISLTSFLIIGITLGTIDTFIYHLNIPHSHTWEGKKFSLSISIPWLLYFYYRYYKKKSIINGKYKIFRERWGDPENVSKRNLKILLVYTLTMTIGLVIFAAIMGHFNSRGYFEGYRLFP